MSRKRTDSLNIHTPTTPLTSKTAAQIQDEFKDTLARMEGVVPKQRFLDTLMTPEFVDVDEVFQDMCDKRSYSKDKNRWTEFPVEIKKEVAMYQPFKDIANAITESACKRKGKEGSFFLGRWVDSHKKSPKSTAEGTTKLQPDIVFVPQGNEEYTEKLAEDLTDIQSDDTEVRFDA